MVYGHLLVITGYKWDYTCYKWGYKYLELVKGHNCMVYGRYNELVHGGESKPTFT